MKENEKKVKIRLKNLKNHERERKNVKIIQNKFQKKM